VNILVESRNKANVSGAALLWSGLFILSGIGAAVISSIVLFELLDFWVLLMVPAFFSLAFFLLVDISDWLVLLMAFFMPLFTQLSVKVAGVVNLDWWDGIIILIVGRRLFLWGLLALRGNLKIRFSALHIYLLLFLFSYGLSFAGSANLVISVGALAKIIMSYGIFWFFLFKIPNQQHVKRFTTLLLLAGLFVATIGIFQQATGQDVTIDQFKALVKQGVEEVQRAGIYSTFRESLLVGGYLGWVLPIAVSLAFCPGLSWTESSFYRLTAIAVLLALVFSQSRGAYAMGGISLLTLLYFNRIRIVKLLRHKTMLILWPVFPLSLIVLSIGVYFVYPGILDRILSVLVVIVPSLKEQGGETMAYGVSSSLHRILAMSAAWKAFQGSPLYGIGAGTFKEVVGYSWAHNSYLHVLTERGIIGLLTYLLLLWGIERRLYHWRRNTSLPYWQALSIGVYAAFIGVITGGSFNSAETIVQVAFYMWFYTRVAQKMLGCVV